VIMNMVVVPIPTQWPGDSVRHSMLKKNLSGMESEQCPEKGIKECSSYNKPIKDK